MKMNLFSPLLLFLVAYIYTSYAMTPEGAECLVRSKMGYHSLGGICPDKSIRDLDVCREKCAHHQCHFMDYNHSDDPWQGCPCLSSCGTGPDLARAATQILK